MSIQHFLDWSGGLQTRTSRFLRKPNEWAVLVNGHTDEIGAVTKRPGYKKVGGTFETGNAITGIGDGGTYLYAGSNNTADSAGQLKYNNSSTAPVGGTWTAVSGGTAIPTDIYYQIVPFAETQRVYIVGAKTVATDEDHFMKTLSATFGTPGTTADVSGAPRSRFAIRWRDRIYHGYCARNTGWSTGNWYNETVEYKANRIIYSNVPTNGAITYEDQGVSGYANFLDLDDDCTGVGTNNDSFLAWTRRSMWVRSGDTTLTWKKRYSIGCVSGYTVQNMDLYTIWLGRKGFYAYAGGKPQLISNGISGIISGITSPQSAFAAPSHDDDHYRCYVGTLTIEGRTFKNCVIQYTLSTNSWAVYSYRVATATTDTITSMGVFDDGTTQRVYFGTSNGQVYVMGEPEDVTQIYADGNQTDETYDITFWARTGKEDNGTPHEIKNSNKLIVYSENAQNTKVNVITDPVATNGDPRPLGQIHKEIEEFTIDPPQHYWSQIEFTETSQRPSLKINGFSKNFDKTTTFVKE